MVTSARKTAPRKRPSKTTQATRRVAAKERHSTASTAAAGGAIVKAVRLLENLRLRGAAAKLVASRRKDLEAIVAANRTSFEGIQAVVKRQTELLKERIGEWRAVAKVMTLAGPKESFAQLDELTKQSFRMSLANIRELAELSVKTQTEAVDLVRSRIRQSVAEIDALLED